jgi:threonine/homoserine/homoserine lactone efflux protein
VFTLSSLLLFISSSILLILAPGPDIVFTITQGITNGRKAGFFTAMGLCFGNSIHTLAAAFGLSVIFKTSELAFILLKTFGAIYLFFLAYKAIKHRNDPLVGSIGYFAGS